MVKNKLLLVAVLLGLFVRLAHFNYNVKLNQKPVWFDCVVNGLAIAEIKNGKPVSMPTPEAFALKQYDYDIRGLAFTHMLFFKLFGTSSLELLKLVLLIIDTLLIFVLYQLALAFSPQIALVTSFLYALNPIAMHLCGVPSWYTFLNAVALITACFLYRKHLPEIIAGKKSTNSHLLSYLSLCALTFFGLIYRAPVFLVLASFTGALLVSYLRKQIRLKTMLLHSCATLITVFLSITANQRLNLHLSGGKSAGRANFSHNFFMGMGERENWYMQKYQLDGSDEAVPQWYVRETGDPVLPDMLSYQPYFEWTTAKAIEVVTKHTGLYATLYLKRIRDMVFPRFRIALVSDVDATARFENQADKEKRLSIVKSGGIPSLGQLAELHALNPVYFYEFLLRIFVMFFLPGGLLLGLIFASREQRFLILNLSWPLMAIMLVLAVIRLPNFDHAAGWHILLPAVAFGYAELIRKCKQRLQ